MFFMGPDLSIPSEKNSNLWKCLSLEFWHQVQSSSASHKGYIASADMFDASRNPGA